MTTENPQHYWRFTYSIPMGLDRPVWRGQHLQKIEPRLKPGGKYEMATLELRKGDTIDMETIRKLTRKAIALNKKLGDPTLAAKG